MAETADEIGQWRDWFKVEGKRYRIFKRVKSKDAPWYLYFERKGRRILRCLDSNVKEHAIAYGRQIVAAVRAENWVALGRAQLVDRTPVATVGEVLRVYEGNPEGIKSCAKSASALRCLARAVTQADAEGIERLKVSVLDARFVARYREAVVAGVEDGDDLSMRKAKITANSYLRQARSIFTERMLEHYRNAKLKVPEMSSFREAPGFAKVRVKYAAPGDDLIAQTFGWIDRLWHSGPGRIRERRRQMFTALCLACGCGMRKGEVAEAKWSWMQIRDGQVWMQSFVNREDSMVAKNGDFVDVPVVMDWWPRLQRVRIWQRENFYGGEHILEGSMTVRTETVFRWVSRWMRRIGWETEKTIHEFRAWVGSKVAEKYGFPMAALFMRHGDERTTRQSYGRYVQLKQVRLHLAP